MKTKKIETKRFRIIKMIDDIKRAMLHSNVNLEIDIVLKTNHNVSMFECKWSNKNINMEQLNKLNIKQEYIKKIFNYHNIKLGFFSKTGYQLEVISNQKDHLLYNLKDLYSL